MISRVRFEKSVADSILSSAMDTYPRETILLMRGKIEGDEILVNDLVIPPLARHGYGFSGFSNMMLPLDLKVIGVSHSHPSGTLRPSIQDLNHFYGRIMAIVAYPFQSYDNIGVFNSNGDKLPHQIVSDYKDPEGQ